MSTASLIVSIVQKGWGSTVLEASVNAGARGGTVLMGRGAGINEQEKIFGMAIDFALWKMGRAPELHASRDEHGGEGITSFGSPFLPGSVFVRGSQVVWASDLATARHGVDLLTAPADTRVAARPPVLALIPRHEGALAAGAIANDDGAVARSLALARRESRDLG